MTVATEAVYDSVEDTSRALYGKQATSYLGGAASMRPCFQTNGCWLQLDPIGPPQGFDSYGHGCFVFDQLVALLQLQSGSTSGPAAISMGSPDTTRALQKRPSLGALIRRQGQGTVFSSHLPRRRRIAATVGLSGDTWWWRSRWRGRRKTLQTRHPAWNTTSGSQKCILQ